MEQKDSWNYQRLSYSLENEKFIEVIFVDFNFFIIINMLG